MFFKKNKLGYTSLAADDTYNEVFKSRLLKMSFWLWIVCFVDGIFISAPVAQNKKLKIFGQIELYTTQQNSYIYEGDELKCQKQ